MSKDQAAARAYFALKQRAEWLLFGARDEEVRYSREEIVDALTRMLKEVEEERKGNA